MSEPRQIAIVNSDDDLSDICRKMALSLGVTYGTLDRYTGATAGFWSKKLAICTYSANGKPNDARGSRRKHRSAQRGWSPESFQAALVAFCFDLIAVPNPEKIAKLRAWMAKQVENPANVSMIRTADANESIVIKLSRRHMKKLSKLAAEGRRKKISRKERVRLAKLAIRARWKRIRVQRLAMRTADTHDAPKAPQNKPNAREGSGALPK